MLRDIEHVPRTFVVATQIHASLSAAGECVACGAALSSDETLAILVRGKRETPTMDPTQLYESTIYNRDRDQAFSFVTVPARSLALPDPPRIEILAKELGLRPIATPDQTLRVVNAVQPWSLPFVVDAMLAWSDPAPSEEYNVAGLQESLAWRFYIDIPNRRGPSDFAQYLSYESVVPIESSPLSTKSLVQLLGGGGGATGAIGYLTGHPLLMVYSAGSIILCGAAIGIAEALRIGGRTTLLQWMGIEQLPDPSPREAEPAGGVDDEDDDEAY